MNNPIAAIRQQLNEQTAEPPKPQAQDDKGFDPNLKALHAGWLQHPVTVERLGALKKELQATEINLKYYSCVQTTPDSFIRSLVASIITLKDTIYLLTKN